MRNGRAGQTMTNVTLVWRRLHWLVRTVLLAVVLALIVAGCGHGNGGY
jgi:hypothetical protein